MWIESSSHYRKGCVIMARTPKKPLERVQFFKDHIAPWTTNATALGTTASAVTALQTKVTAAETAYDAQQSARQVSENATEAFRLAVAAVNAAGQAIIKNIESTAQSTGNPGVYTLAQLPPPATPTPAGAPGKPFDFKVGVGTTGALELTWKNTNAAGAVYMVYRKLGLTGEFQLLQGTGEKKLIDSTVPAGTVQVQYQIQAVRSTGVSDFAMFVVNLGTSPTTGARFANVADVEQTKLAA
jgi:hypothetical protein